jgi:hypothetical protein
MNIISTTNTSFCDYITDFTLHRHSVFETLPIGLPLQLRYTLMLLERVVLEKRVLLPTTKKYLNTIRILQRCSNMEKSKSITLLKYVQ